MRSRLLPILVLAAAGAFVPVALLHFLGRHEVHIPGTIHFTGVGLTALAAVGAALALTVVGARRGDGRAVLVGTAFTVMAALLSLHGLATPGVILGDNGVVAFTGGATLPVGGAVLALSAIPALRRPQAVRPLIGLQIGLVTAIAALGTAGALVPNLVPSVPEPGSALAIGVLTVGVAFYGTLAFRAFRTYLLTRRSADLLVVSGIVWLAAALVASLTLDWWDLGWWLGHAFELVGIAAVGSAVALDLHRGVQSRPLVGDLSAVELVSAEEAFLGSQVRALMVVLARKDEYTEEHTRRVAMRAVQVGEELGLGPVRLRGLAAGGLLHDIGKLSVPDAVLKKPSSLEEEEFAVIKQHPEWGLRLIEELGGFPPAVKQLILDHHERLDGNGYPRGLTGEEIDLDARILGVCDVYDALMSPRVYRPAWTHAAALGHLRAAAGSAFDRRCVEALERVLARELGDDFDIAV